MFKLSRDPYGEFMVHGNNLPRWMITRVRNIITNNHMDSEDYKMKRKPQPFLQGAFDENTPWFRIEFMNRDEKVCQEYLDYINQKIEIEKQHRAGANVPDDFKGFIYPDGMGCFYNEHREIHTIIRDGKVDAREVSYSERG